MTDYNDILTEMYNPVKVDDGNVTFPTWLTDDNVIALASLPMELNQSVEDQIIKKHASFYDAIHWYPSIKNYTPESIFLKLSEEEIFNIITDNVFPEKYRLTVEKYLKDGFQFVKSSTKSSHQMKRVVGYDDFLDEVMHPNLIMSFKKGCRYLMFRKYIDCIYGEYRIYVYQNKIRYMEQYIGSCSDPEKIKSEILEHVNRVKDSIRYQDYVLDICSSENQYLVIEINTPMYLFGGIHLLKYNSDYLHTTETPLFYYQNSNKEIYYI